MKRPVSMAWLLIVGAALAVGSAGKGAAQRPTPEWSMTPQAPTTPEVETTRTTGTPSPGETPRARFTRTPGRTPTPSADRR